MDTYSGLMPHRVRSSHDELNAADICKPPCDVETGMKESGGGISCPSLTTAPLTPGSSLQVNILKPLTTRLLLRLQVPYIPTYNSKNPGQFFTLKVWRSTYMRV